MFSPQSNRQYIAEFFGTLVLMVFGFGVNAQVVLGERQFGDWLSMNFGWGLAVMFGVYVCGKISGAHLNPAVTLAMAIRGAFPWKRVAPFIVLQVLAAFLASALVYATYYEAFDSAEQAAAAPNQAEAWVSYSPDSAGRTMATAGVFGTYPNGALWFEKTVSNWTGLIDQIVGTALLLICICAVTDEKNGAPKSNLAPMMIGASVLLIGIGFGFNCGYAINPARDFGPRLFTLVAGYGPAVFTTPNAWWWLVPIVGPFIGGVIGVLMYDACITRCRGKDDDD